MREDFDDEEAMEYALHKRRFLLQRLINHFQIPIDDEEDEEEYDAEERDIEDEEDDDDDEEESVYDDESNWENLIHFLC